MTTQKLPPEVFGKKGVLRNFGKFTGKQETLIKKETMAQVFSCEFCEISKNNFFHRTPLAAPSDDISSRLLRLSIYQF